jgi:hypothetical protein
LWHLLSAVVVLSILFTVCAIPYRERLAQRERSERLKKERETLCGPLLAAGVQIQWEADSTDIARLDLSGLALSPDMLGALRRLQRVRRIDLTGTGMTDAEVDSLVRMALSAL